MVAAEFHEWLSAWSTAGAAVVVSISAVVAVVQLVELRRARQAEAVFRVLDLLSGVPFHRQRAALLQRAPLPSPDEMPEEDFVALWAELRPVSIVFDQVGLLARRRMVPRVLVLDMYRDTIVNTWDVLEPYIRRERLRRPMPQYQYHFEWLYERACRFRRRPYRRCPPTHRFRVETATPSTR